MSAVKCILHALILVAILSTMGSVERLTQYLSDLPSRATAFAAGALSFGLPNYNDKENSLVLSEQARSVPSR